MSSMAATTVVRARTIVTPVEEIIGGAVLVENGRIGAVGPAATIGVPRGARVLDWDDLIVAPGFVDAHVHGGGGFSVMDGRAAVIGASTFMARHGVTSWLPTLMAMATLDELVDLTREVAALDTVGDDAAIAHGADVAGLHLEGPFLNPKRPGALRADWMRAPSVPELIRLLDASHQTVRLMTVAPELTGGVDLVRALAGRGVVASVGHSDARYEQVVEAIGAGLSYATHTFNAMPVLHHRSPGVVGAVLAADSVFAELIPDGVHVHPALMKMLIRAKGAHRVVAITDATHMAGLGDGSFTFGGLDVTVANGRATLADGTIAGSVGTLDANLGRLIEGCGLTQRDAIRLATLNPSLAVGLSGRKGALRPGLDADLVVLDRQMTVVMSMVRGIVVYSREER